VVASTVYTYKV